MAETDQDAAWEDDPLQVLEPAERALLDEASVPLGPHRSTLGSLVQAWGAHVRRFVDELDIDPTDPQDRWTPHDFVAALYIRTFVQDGLEKLPPGTVTVAERALAPVDEEFRAFTEHDDANLLEPWLTGDLLGAGWWWQRIPREGPVRFDMNELHERLAGDQSDPPSVP